MGSVNLAVQVIEGIGPRGGNLHDPMRKPEARNAPLSSHVISTPSGDKVIGLHDSREYDSAIPGIQKEQAWHRMAAHMLNNGFTNIVVAQCADVTPQQVSNLRGQRWFNELCATLAEDKNKVIKARLDGYALEAVEAIHEIATDSSLDEDGKPLVSPRVKLAAHLSLLEHSQGKATQKVLSVSATTSFSSEREEYDSILRELQGVAPALLQPQPTPAT